MNQFPFHYLERDGGNVEIFGGKPIAQLLDSAGDLVKVHSLRPGQDVMIFTLLGFKKVYLPSLLSTIILLPVAFAISISSSLELVLEFSLQQKYSLVMSVVE